MSIKTTTTITGTFAQPIEVQLDVGKIVQVQISTPVDPSQTSATITWWMGYHDTNGNFIPIQRARAEVAAMDLFIAMSQLVVVGENVGQGVERVIWDYLIQQGIVPPGTIEV